MRAQEFITENFADVDQNTDKSITYNGQSYMNTPRIHNLIKQAQAIESQLPKVKSGMTRLWRGNREGEIGSNPSFTNSLVGIALPFLEQYGGSLTYIDVPTQDLSQYVHSVASAPGSEFTVTPELANQAQTVKENFADGKGPGRPGDSQRHGIPKKATMAELEKASHAKGRKGQLARWQLNMRRGKKKAQ
jgi:hypothetical protein